MNSSELTIYIREVLIVLTIIFSISIDKKYRKFILCIKSINKNIYHILHNKILYTIYIFIYIIFSQVT